MDELLLPAPEEGGTVEVPLEEPTEPAEVHGGVVRRSGIALVHEGEVILAAPGSEAEVERAEQDARMTIVYRLPVEIEVIGRLEPAVREDIIQEALRRLRRAIQARPVGG